MQTKKLGWPGPKAAKCRTKNRSHTATVNKVQGTFWKLKQTVRAFLRSAPVLPFLVGPIPTDHPWRPASLPLPIRHCVPVPSNWIRGFIQLTGLVRDGRWKKTLDPYPLSIVEPWITRAAVVCSLLLSPGSPMLRPRLRVGCLGLLRLETSEAMPAVSYYTWTMSCFNSRQPSEVAICAVPWLADPVGFGSRRTWPKKVLRTSLSSRPACARPR